MEEKRQNQIKEWISENPKTLQLLKLLREFDHANGSTGVTWLSAGHLRALIWNKVFRVEVARAEADIDLIYFDRNDLAGARAKSLRAFLEKSLSEATLDVQNQAFLWKKNGDEPYQYIEDALRCWPETVTAIAVSLDPEDRIHVLAPFGTKDLFQGVVKPTPHFSMKKIDQYRFRQNEKKWWEHWPKIRILELQEIGEN